MSSVVPAGQIAAAAGLCIPFTNNLRFVGAFVICGGVNGVLLQL
jgi:hypothetical protein